MVTKKESMISWAKTGGSGIATGLSFAMFKDGADYWNAATQARAEMLQIEKTAALKAVSTGHGFRVNASQKRELVEPALKEIQTAATSLKTDPVTLCNNPEVRKIGLSLNDSCTLVDKYNEVENAYKSYLETTEISSLQRYKDISLGKEFVEPAGGIILTAGFGLATLYLAGKSFYKTFQFMKTNRKAEIVAENPVGN